MNFTDDDLNNMTKDQLIELVKNSQKTKSKPKSKKLPSKPELFDNIMESTESEYGDVPGDLIIDALVKTERFSLVKARQYLSDAYVHVE